MKYYAGIGSRQVKTDPIMTRLMKQIASALEEQGWTLRSGAADGADSAFASGVKKRAEIWIPWKNFGEPHNPNHTYRVISNNDKNAFESVNQFHPSGPNLSQAARKLMARNYRQIVSTTIEDGNDSKFVICWTPNGELKGGTAQAIKIAESLNIPVFNLAIKKDYDRISTWLKLQQRREPEEMSDWEYLEEDPMNEQFYGQG